MNKKEKYSEQFTQVRATLRCNTLLLLWWWIASWWALDELVQGKNSLLRRVLGGVWLREVRMIRPGVVR